MTDTPQPRNHLKIFSQRVGTYSTLSFITLLGVIIPSTKLFAFLGIMAYFCYMGVDTLRIYANHEKNSKDPKKSLRWAMIDNSQDLVYFLIAVVVGLVVGMY